MDRGLYISMSGAKQTLIAQAVNSHNLANASTTGFKADLAQFRSMPVYGPGLPTRAYAMTERHGIDFNSGTVQQTGRDLDISLQSDGWIAVQSKSGEEAYTRSGDLRVTPDGLLITGSGLPVLGNGGPITIPASEKLEIGNDGTISVIPLGDSAATLAAIDRIKLVNPDLSQVTKGTDGLFRMNDDSIAAASADVRVVSGTLESSNVSVVDAMVTMIELARNFEMQVKMMETLSKNEEASAQLMRVS